LNLYNITLINNILKNLFTIVSILIAQLLFAQESKDSVWVQAKIWSRDANREIQYSDWKLFGSKTVDLLNGFSPAKSTQFDKYGGNQLLKFNSNGYFSIIKKDSRWWIVDPLGNAFVNIAVNGVRLGKSPKNELAFNEKFTNTGNWIGSTKEILDINGFNSTGSWSDIETIKSYNKKSEKPIVYCTQLSLLSTFSQKQRKKTANKEYPVLANVFNADFKEYCINRVKELIDLDSKDRNLFGHFSDNELPFQNDLLKEFLEINDTNDKAYQLALQWLAENKINQTATTKEQREMFSGFVAAAYYQLINDVIKSVDANHLYLGSRLHSSAKNNPYILSAAEKFIDIISINYYGNWAVTEKHKQQWEALEKPFIVTEFYTKGEDTKMGNMTGAGWLVKTQLDRGIHYQNFCLKLLQIKNCVGWHWFRYQDNDPEDKTADQSNNDANKGIVNTQYEVYSDLLKKMKQLNSIVYDLIKFFDQL
jgi:hypothetical protein